MKQVQQDRLTRVNGQEVNIDACRNFVAEAMSDYKDWMKRLFADDENLGRRLTADFAFKYFADFTQWIEDSGFGLADTYFSERRKTS